MATIESSLGSIPSSNSTPMKKWVVDDPTMDIPDSEIKNPHYKPVQQQMKVTPEKEQEMFEKFQEAKRQKNTINPESKKKIEALLGLRKIIKSTTIDGITFTLKNLNANCTRIAYKAVAERSATNVDMMFYSRNVYLALSLHEIDGQPIEEILGEKEIDIDTRLSLIDEMDDNIINELYSFYDKEIKIKLPDTAEAMAEVQGEIKK